MTRIKKIPDYDYELNAYYNTSKTKRKSTMTFHYEYDSNNRITKIFLTEINYKEDGRIEKIVSREDDKKTDKTTIKTLYGRSYNDSTR